MERYLSYPIIWSFCSSRIYEERSSIWGTDGGNMSRNIKLSEIIAKSMQFRADNLSLFSEYYYLML